MEDNTEMSQRVMVTIGSKWVPYGEVDKDEYTYNAPERFTPIHAIDFYEPALLEASNMGAVWAKIVRVNPKDHSQFETWYVKISELLEKGVRFRIADDRYIYCPVNWLKDQKWQQLPLSLE